jgi:arylsulfatase A-like enzyme
VPTATASPPGTSPPPSPPPSAWRWVLAGAAGGAFAGAIDAAGTAVRGVGGVTGGRLAWLACVAVGLAATAGVALVAAALGVNAALRRVVAPARAAAITAAALAAPLVAYAAFAMFSGAKAARIPGHRAISVALVLVGLAVVAGLAVLHRRLLAAAVRRRSWAAAATMALVVVAPTLLVADRVVLPRLYLWFHLALMVAFLVTLVLAAQLLAAAAVFAPPARERRRALIAVAAVAVLLAAGLPALKRSQVVRFAAHERTQLTAHLLHLVPIGTTGVVRRLPRAGGASGAGGAGAGPAAALPEGPRHPSADVVLVTVDALRADHVGAYGYQRNVTPNIDALARRGVRFERAYTQAPHTSFSVASMLTGKYYPTIARLAPGDTHDPIALLLQRYGWKTAAFYPPAVFFVDSHKLKAYEKSNFNFEYVKVGDYAVAPERFKQVQEFFVKERPRKAFLWLHLFDPHEPYDAVPGFDFGKRDIDRYDAEIAYTDAVVGKLVEYIEETRPGAIIILTADHGEEFDEHGGRYHGTSLYDEQVRVPLIMVVPGVSPRVVSGQVELVDLMPTILGLVDIPIPARLRGTDLGPWLASPRAPDHLLPPAFAEVAEMRMVTFDLKKAIWKMNWGYWELYDLRSDPGEKKNIADERPGDLASLKQKLDGWLDDHVRYEPQLARGLSNPGGEAVPKAIERGRLGDLMVMEELAAMLQSSQHPLPVRREAARLLVSLPPRKETRDRVLAAAHGADDAEVRDWSAVAATRLGDTAAREHLRAIVARPDPQGTARELREEAALALAHVKDPAGVEVLAAALDQCQERILHCQLIIIKLGALRDPRAVPALLAHLPEVQNRREMVEALGAIGDRRAVPALIERLKKDEYVPVRAVAAAALARIGGPAATAALEWSLKHESEQSVLSAARAGLESGPPAP